MNSRVDVRHVLSAVRVPTLVLHRQGDRDSRVEEGRHIAEHIEGATFVELAGEDHFVAIDPDQILDPVEAFVTGHEPARRSNRTLATVLFVDIVESTRRALALGDAKWAATLNRFQGAAAGEVAGHGGRHVATTGDGLLATFDGPARAVRCGCAIRDGARLSDLEVRCGLHTAEIELRGADVAGIGVHVGARVAALARPGEVWVSRTVRDLVAGSGLRFEERGTYTLKGIDEAWALYAATT
jgi:class 3 adenylate cyclase